ncbi:DUF6504 family protein [Kribbella shirazensis]|uniref:DUF6504 domain-containing protein n=1 Tax=Kribbella shirazensis TaxID=1105143 RepID=A0A7X5VFX5_9ACTN|nr:DUF6504 family protein [Kribbella shirazensis]NIK60478.1 hypothetical protein [Kribbella shirazensis]
MWEFDDAVEVHSVSVDGVQTPDQFLWRGRLWRVRSVKSHWTETAAWWERGVIGTGDIHDPQVARAFAGPADNRAVLAYDARADRRTAPDSLARIDAATVAEVCSAARSTRSTRTRAGVAAAANPRSRPAATLPSPSQVTPAAVGVLDAEWGPERAVFRVEAGCGRYGRQEMFDLAHDPDSGRWQLERVTDR